VEDLIRLVPTVLPVIGGPGISPPLRDQERRAVVDKKLNKLNINSEEWWELAKALPELASELKLLIATLEALQNRFAGEDEDHQEEIDAQFESLAEQEARGIETRVLIPVPPERRIYRKELECIKAYCSLVSEAVGRDESQKGWDEEKITPENHIKRTASHTTSTPTPTKRYESPVVLNGPDDNVIVWGKEKAPLAPAQYRVVKALVEAHARGERLSKDKLCAATKDEKGDTVEDPVGALKRLRRRDPDWERAINMAKVPGRGYGLKEKPPTPT
jgi:hypothetical protein